MSNATVRRPAPVLFFILFLALTCHPASADDWAQWRGPKRDGVSPETGLMKSWGSNGPPFLWMARGIGAGYSSVSVVGNRIFTTGEGADSSFVHALSISDKGKILWSSRLGKPGGGARYAGPPTVEGDRVYALGQFGDLSCLQIADGKEVWHKNLKTDLGGVMMNNWGYSESVLVDGENVICTPGGKGGTLAALDRRTGQVIWRSTELQDRAAYSSIVQAEIGGVRQYIQLTDVSVAGIAAENGKLLWRAARRGSTGVVPTPIYKDGYVLVTSGYRVGCNLFRVSSEAGKFAATQVYANHDLENHHGGVVLIGDHVYGHSDGRGWVCMDFKTGALVWSKQGVGRGSVMGVEGKLICRSEGPLGTVALVDASPEGYKELGRFDQPERGKQEARPQPVVANGRLYLRDMDVLLCFDVKKK